MRKDFEMSEEQLSVLLDACKPTPTFSMFGDVPVFGTPQENANYAWQKLGDDLGFVGDTAIPNGKGDRFFSAEEL